MRDRGSPIQWSARALAAACKRGAAAAKARATSNSRSSISAKRGAARKEVRERVWGESVHMLPNGDRLCGGGSSVDVRVVDRSIEHA